MLWTHRNPSYPTVCRCPLFPLNISATQVDHPSQPSATFKLLVVGDSGVGKTCLTLKFIKNTFAEEQGVTVGIDMLPKLWDWGTHKFNLQIWDTAGEERFRTVVNSYYRGAHGVLLLYDVTNRSSFENIKTWLTEIRRNAAEGVKIILVGTKIDLAGERKVSDDQIQEFSTLTSLRSMQVSSKTGEGVKECFFELTKEMAMTVLTHPKEKEKIGAKTLQDLND